ncbi:MAG: hypothetical protein H0T51_27040 [Pirellulales bacterium]|nr:hypothetical protein [Pirellulales bacterium]
MRTALAGVAILIAIGLFAYLVIGWGAAIQTQGLEAAFTDQTTQPSLPATVGGSILGIGLLFVGLSLLRGRDKE